LSKDDREHKRGFFRCWCKHGLSGGTLKSGGGQGKADVAVVVHPSLDTEEPGLARTERVSGSVENNRGHSPSIASPEQGRQEQIGKL
jgi:hypothetical protein